MGGPALSRSMSARNLAASRHDWWRRTCAATTRMLETKASPTAVSDWLTRRPDPSVGTRPLGPARQYLSLEQCAVIRPPLLSTFAKHARLRRRIWRNLPVLTERHVKGHSHEPVCGSPSPRSVRGSNSAGSSSSCSNATTHRQASIDYRHHTTTPPSPHSESTKPRSHHPERPHFHTIICCVAGVHQSIFRCAVASA